MSLIRHLVDRKTLKILDLLLKNKEKHFHLSEISGSSKVPVGSTFRIVNQLASLGIVDVTMLGKMKIYRISSKDDVKELELSIGGKQKK